MHSFGNFKSENIGFNNFIIISRAPENLNIVTAVINAIIAGKIDIMHSRPSFAPFMNESNIFIFDFIANIKIITIRLGAEKVPIFSIIMLFYQFSHF